MADTGSPTRLDRSLLAWTSRIRRRTSERTSSVSAAEIVLDGGITIHAALDVTGQGIDLGVRVSDESNPDGLVNLEQVNALLRAISDDPRSAAAGLAVYVEVQGRCARRWRLHHHGLRDEPTLADPPGRICECGLGLEPPDGMPHWWPDRHPDPGPEVYAVAVCNEAPLERHAVRREDGAGWRERGRNIYFPGSITWDWSDVGRCPSGRFHPVRRLGL